MRKIIVSVFMSLLLFATCTTDKPGEAMANNTPIVRNLRGEIVDITALDQYLATSMLEMKIPGLSLAIINEGKVVFTLSKGYADTESKTPVKDNTIFEAASVSKAVFAHMVLVLVDKGLLDLDRPLYTYLDEGTRAIYDFDEQYKQITGRMVLSHTTGFPNWRGNGELTINFEPGTSFGYSGEGYQFLVRVVQTILDTDYQGVEAFFQAQIARPLGLEHTKFVQDHYNRTNKARPHLAGKVMAQNLWEAAEFNAASALHTEAQEFAQWMIALIDSRILSAATGQLMLEDQITVAEAPHMLAKEGVVGWTLGFAKYDIDGHIVYGHEGNNDGFNALFLLDKEKKWGMVQFNNAQEVYDFGFDLFKFLHSSDNPK